MSSVTRDGRDWKYLGRCLRAARDGRPRSEIATAADVSEPTIKRYERGLINGEEVPDKLQRLANFYRWSPDSLDRILDEGPPARPQYVPPPLPPAAAEWFADAVKTNPSMTDAQKEELLGWITGRPGGPRKPRPAPPIG